MRIQDWIVRQTQRALDDLIRNAKSIAVADHEFAPTGGRSVLNQLQEIAVSDFWLLPIISNPEKSVSPKLDMEIIFGMMAEVPSVALCEAAARSGTAKICQKIVSFPDEHLENLIFLDFGLGLNLQMVDVLALHSWNITYHLGQICQIQMMLGDKKMH